MYVSLNVLILGYVFVAVYHLLPVPGCLLFDIVSYARQRGLQSMAGAWYVHVVYMLS